MGAGAITTMFDRIARSYGRLNRLFSLGADNRWRRILVGLARAVPPGRVLDVCTGTADLPLVFARAGAARAIVGVDLSEGMLAVGRRKIEREGAGDRIRLERGDALELPFDDGSFDVVSNAFGLRNLPDRARGIAEMARVLRPGGRLLVLEFAPPRPGPAGRLFHRYLSSLVPFVGGLVSRQPRAYRYLRDSIVAFLEPGKVVALLREAGLVDVRALPLTGGIAFLYRGRVPLPGTGGAAAQP